MPVKISDDTYELLVKRGYKQNVKSMDTVIKESFCELESLETKIDNLIQSYNELQDKFDSLLEEHLSFLRRISGDDK